MFATIHKLTASVKHLFFPHVCRACYKELSQSDHFLCTNCLSELPYTTFEKIWSNPVEKIFFGRTHVEAASSFLYFTPSSSVQRLIHEIKYRNQQQLAIYLGKAMGYKLSLSARFQEINLVVPLPLFRTRQRERGYNQAALLARGISEATGKPLAENAVKRIRASSTQTRKNREERWQNVDGLFKLTDKTLIENQNILLVDDVITTGATLESCARTLKEAKGVKIWISTLAYAMH